MTAGEEIAQNNARIAQLKQRLAELENSTSGNALDMRLAANRARIGDFGNAQSHLGRIETRNQWEQTKLAAEKQRLANRISDAEYQYAQLDSAVRTAKTELAYADPTNTRTIKQLEDNVRAAEEKRDAFLAKNPFLAVKAVSAAQQRNSAPQAPESSDYTIEGAKALYDSMTYQGKDGKTYWKDDADPEKYWEYHDRVNASENEDFRAHGRTARATQTMKQNVTDNTALNLGQYLKSIDNLRNGKFTSVDAKKKAKEMWEALDEQQKRDNPDLKKKIFDTPDPAEWRTWLAKSKASAKNAYDSLSKSARDIADEDGEFKVNGITYKRIVNRDKSSYWYNPKLKRTW